MTKVYCHNCGHEIHVKPAKHYAIGLGIAAFGVIGWFSFLFAGSGHAFLIASGITVFGLFWMYNAKSTAKEEVLKECCPYCGRKTLHEEQKEIIVTKLPSVADTTFEDRLKMLDDVLAKHNQTFNNLYTPNSSNQPHYTSAHKQIAIAAHFSEFDDCPKCSGHLIKRYSTHGAFLGCSNFPRCKFTFDKPELCPQCHEGQLKKKVGKKGNFIGCSNYPNCRYTKDI